jgi:hypothetical protein
LIDGRFGFVLALSGLLAVFFEPFGWTLAVCGGNFVLEKRRFLHVLPIDSWAVAVKGVANIESIDYIEKHLLTPQPPICMAVGESN